MCYDIDIQEVAGVEQCGEPEREGKRVHIALLGGWVLGDSAK